MSCSVRRGAGDLVLPETDLNRFPGERVQIDAESIVMDLLARSFDGSDFPDARVFNEIDVDTDAYASVTDVVVFHCEPPVVGTSNHRGRFWQVDMSLLVETVDADRSFMLAAFLRRAVMAWPRMTPIEAGQVVKVLAPPSFAKAASGKQATSKMVRQYSTASACTLLLRDFLS